MSIRDSVAKWTKNILNKNWSTTQNIDITNSQRLTSLFNSVFKNNNSNINENDSYQRILNPGYHFVYHNPISSKLGQDGYDNYQAPLNLSGKEIFKRRMWVGGVIEYINPIKFGSQVTCTENINSVRYLSNQCFVNINRRFHEGGNDLLLETRTLVYSNDNYIQKELPPYKIDPSLTSIKVKLDSTQNFRYSSLTYNAHKIHYNLEHCKSEGFPNILISGPFIISLLLEWFRNCHPKTKIEKISYKNKLPIFEDIAINFTEIKTNHIDGLDHVLLQIMSTEGVLVEAKIVCKKLED
ncbi:hydroxyacyl-thioester dehydratase type 2, mitochondrial [[Candida] anglica]|uniref:Hydroxyacyl-thioester dehydratase type 2, mitochondrial n=1 Tax=[Candida] anglica TaxID=148631 RepID=A0ABP0E6H6_9ASCO